MTEGYLCPRCTRHLVGHYCNAAFAAGPTGDYWVDTSAGAFTMTLPDPPLNQNCIRIQDLYGTFSVNPLTINPGTKTVLGTSGKGKRRFLPGYMRQCQQQRHPDQVNSWDGDNRSLLLPMLLDKPFHLNLCRLQTVILACRQVSIIPQTCKPI